MLLQNDGLYSCLVYSFMARGFGNLFTALTFATFHDFDLRSTASLSDRTPVSLDDLASINSTGIQILDT